MCCGVLCFGAPCRAFLTQYASVLNWNTTTALLESYGRLQELEVFAGAKGDQEALLEYLMRNPDGAKRCAGCFVCCCICCLLLYVLRKGV